MKRTIIATSTACLDQFFNDSEVNILRMHLHIDGKDYLDDKAISHQEVISRMQADEKLSPITQPATYDEISDMLLKLIDQGYEEVLAIVMSSGLSETYNHLVNLGQIFSSKLKVHTFDSRGLSYPEAVFTIYATQAMKKEIPFVTIIRQLEQMRERHFAYFMIDDFRNMVHTKRISPVVGFIAGSLGISQIVELDDTGNAAPYKKIMGTERALKHLCHTMSEKIVGKEGVLYFLGFNDPDYRQYAQNFFAEQGHAEVLVYPFSSTSIANLGVLGMGIGFFEFSRAVPTEAYTPVDIISRI